mmetsp:Transcript_60953/g.176398  ORF Transcript_60953/g.176398 Transcript_60953/m.176398 type:complete len:210 (+) Transcript_60953:914-1543(+)
MHEPAGVLRARALQLLAPPLLRDEFTLHLIRSGLHLLDVRHEGTLARLHLLHELCVCVGGLLSLLKRMCISSSRLGLHQALLQPLDVCEVILLPCLQSQDPVRIGVAHTVGFLRQLVLHVINLRDEFALSCLHICAASQGGRKLLLQVCFPFRMISLSPRCQILQLRDEPHVRLGRNNEAVDSVGHAAVAFGLAAVGPGQPRLGGGGTV